MSQSKPEMFPTYARDMRCPYCGEMMTSHVVSTRHAEAGCDESFTGPELRTYDVQALIRKAFDAGFNAALENGWTQHDLKLRPIDTSEYFEKWKEASDD